MTKLVNTSCPICGSNRFEMTKTEVMSKEIFRKKLVERNNDNTFYKGAKFVLSSSLSLLAKMNGVSVNDELIDLGVDEYEYLVSKIIVDVADINDPIETIYEINVMCKDCGFQIM